MNIIDAIISIVENPVTDIVSVYKEKNRANSDGAALEEYVRDLFAGTFDIEKNKRDEIHMRVFSYKGNDTNPPDMILRGGDAIEVKKIEKKGSSLALNSSYPKHKLMKTDPMININCQSCEEWDEKDIIYVVGVVSKKKLVQLCMVYGEDYCASKKCYQDLRDTIKKGIKKIPVKHSDTQELGRMNEVDPLKVTFLRVRPMWVIKNPWGVFDYVYQSDPDCQFNFMCIINEDKWNSFENVDSLLSLEKDSLTISDIEIKDPDNPTKKRKAKLVQYKC